MPTPSLRSSSPHRFAESQEFAKRIAKKIENIKESGADVVAMDCPGCMMQIRGGLDARDIDIKVKHTAEIIAEKRGLI